LLDKALKKKKKKHRGNTISREMVANELGRSFLLPRSMLIHRELNKVIDDISEL